MDKQEQNPRTITGGGLHSHGMYDGKDGSKTKAGVRGVYYYTDERFSEDYDIAGNKMPKNIDFFEGVSVYGLGDRKSNKKLVN